MKKIVLSVVGAVALFATPGLAADLVKKAAPVVVAAPSAWDIAFGGALMTDYNFRGISQSNRAPSATAYFEPRFNLNSNFQLYAGIAGSAVRLPTQPSAEIDFYAGVRPTFGPVALDFGFIYYYYPKEVQQFGTGPFLASFTLADTDFWEVYGKATWTINDYVALGANFYYSPSWLNTGASGTYLSGTAKFTAPNTVAPVYVSAELGRYWLGTTNADGNAYVIPVNLADYTYWNIGIGATWKALTVDLRYHDTNLSRESCYILTADPGSRPGGVVTPIVNPAGFRSNWCNSAIVGKLSFDTTIGALK